MNSRGLYCRRRDCYFFLPYLHVVSTVGYELMKSAAGPLEPVLISIVKFIFGHPDWRQSVPGSSPLAGTPGPMTANPFLLFIQKILTLGTGLPGFRHSLIVKQTNTLILALLGNLGICFSISNNPLDPVYIKKQIGIHSTRSNNN